jgi:thymidylate synthase (FAD)
MKVELIGHTVPANSASFLKDAEEFIAYCARISNPANQWNTETSKKLIKYLVDNKHWSPLEMYHVVLDVTTTRDIARQLLRHRSFTFQEFSQRYADVSQGGLSLEPREARLQDTKNRQNSISSGVEPAVIIEWGRRQKQIITEVMGSYQWALDNGIAKEVARAILPEGLTESRLYVSGSLRSWVTYCMLRCSNGTQKEHMILARECATQVATIFPLINQYLPS